jgi:hypothetical protein
MGIAAYLAKLAEGISNTGVLGAPKGGTGITTPGSNGSVLISNGTTWTTQVFPKYVNLSMVGAIAPPFTGLARFYPPTNIVIDTVYANLAESPTGGPITFTLNKNGATTNITGTIIVGTTVMAPLSVNIVLTTTDYLTLDVAGSATFARDLYVRLKYV